jgi:transposase
MTLKFVRFSPLYHLEEEFQRQGFKLSPQAMANWSLQTSDTWLRPVYDELHRKLCQETVQHGDEIALQVLKEPDRLRKQFLHVGVPDQRLCGARWMRRGQKLSSL